MPPTDPVKEVKGLFRLSLMLNPQPASALPRASINPFFFLPSEVVPCVLFSYKIPKKENEHDDMGTKFAALCLHHQVERRPGWKLND